jgi:hypothetical protein
MGGAASGQAYPRLEEEDMATRWTLEATTVKTIRGIAAGISQEVDDSAKVEISLGTLRKNGHKSSVIVFRIGDDDGELILDADKVAGLFGATADGKFIVPRDIKNAQPNPAASVFGE